MTGRLLYTSVVAVAVWFLTAPAAPALVAIRDKVTQITETVDARGEAADAARARELAKRIDATIMTKWKAAKIKPAPAAADTEFFRRVMLDLTGQVPTLLEVRDFLDDPNPNKRTDWIERLLADERYPMHFSYVWRGVMLSTRTEANLVPARQSFERWLQDRLKTNQRHDITARELLMLVRKPGEPGAPNAFTIYHGNKAEEQTGAAARVVLGVNIECAQCHPHPFADWTKQQFWEFAAFFNQQGIKTAGNGMFQRPEIVMPGSEKKVKGKFLDGTVPPETSPDNPRTQLAFWATKKDNPYFAKATVDHLWSYFFGVSLLEPLQASEKTGVTHPELLDLLAKELVDCNFDVKHLIRGIVYTQAYQRTSKFTGKDDEQLAFFARMPVRGLSADQLFDSFMVATNTPHSESPTVYTNVNVQFVGPGLLNERNQFLVKFADIAKSTEASTSILQALYLMNSSFINNRIDPRTNSVLQVLAGTKGSAKRQVETLFLIALSRAPSESELQQVVPYVESGGTSGNRAQALGDVLWALLNSSEFAVNH
jgi:hypothetical protein